MPKKELAKSYDPKQYEEDLYKSWEKSGFFNPDKCIEAGITKSDAPPFSIILPPPNVTGTLHIGHAAMLAIEDVMIRYHRMKGDRTLWVPGTDHAAIATQEKVEKIMWNEEKLTRHDLGRDAFLKRVEAYAQASHDTIVNQSKRMGTSMDWSREYYSLDEKRNLAVRVAFKKMYDEGLIYRGDRIVNWDPKMQSNVSDIEVVRKEEKAPFYYLQYGPFVIGTARPETKFGDKYVVMHPDDERYAQFKDGDTFECEWINGSIKATVIKDESVDMEFGSGVMTITPWHDATDFFIAERHGLDKEQIIDLDGNLLSIAGEFAGMSIKDARKKIVEKLEAKGLLVKIDENYIHNLATNSRGGGLIEPQIMKQWWVDVDKEFKMQDSKIDGVKDGDVVTLQKLMQHAVRSSQIKILPERFEKNYFNWVDNLLDWCISRQLWYGHRIPVWYCVGVDACKMECKEPIVSIEPVTKCPHCGTTNIKQDPDTLDTWFSAGLFSFSPLGWPGEQSEDLKTYHPTSVLETGYDILTFWVVRMVLMTTYLLGEIPFKTVYLHGLVRDEHGNKMSKSLGNIIDPLDMCEKFGTDATRLSLLIGSGPGADSRLSEEKIAGFRNFTNKLWNISRFVLLNIDEPQIGMQAPKVERLEDIWILAKLEMLVESVTKHLEEFAFSTAGEELRTFTWSELADWYLEFSKGNINKELLNYILNTVLTLWHPYTPFVTEALWKEMYGNDALLMVQRWPASQDKPSAPKKKANKTTQKAFEIVEKVKEIIIAIRTIKNDYSIVKAKKVSIHLEDKELSGVEYFVKNIQSMAGVEAVDFNGSIEKELVATHSFVGGNVHVHLSGEIDIEKEQARLEKEIAHVGPYVINQEKKLSNKNFTNNAPKEVVEEEQKKLAEAQEKLKKCTEQLNSLSK